MKNIFLILVFWLLGQDTFAQTPLFKWTSGSDDTGQPSVTKTTAIGARANAASWVDEEGNFWVFGGEGYDEDGVKGTLNDLWKYSPSENKWTWKSGSKKTGATEDLTDDHSLRFDGYDDVLEMDDFSDYHLNFTWEIWIKTFDGNGTIIEYAESQESGSCCSGAGNLSLVLVDGKVQAFTGYAPTVLAQSTSKVNDGEWHHIALSLLANPEDGREVVKIFIDGSEEDSFALDFDDAVADGLANGYVTKIGNGYVGGLEAYFDNFRVWEVIRTSEQIIASMIESLNGEETDLVVYYEFNQGIANGDNQDEILILDKTLFANNGQLKNFVKPFNLDGDITQVKIWNAVRSAEEIAENVGSRDATPTNLLVYYDFSEGIAEDDNTALLNVIDQTANGNDGTLNNFYLNGPESNYGQGTSAYFATVNSLEDFESGDGGWTSTGPVEGFVWGSPVVDIPSSFGNSWSTAYDGDDISLDGIYYLTSPALDFSSLNDVSISFDLFMGVRGDNDAFWLEASIDGLNWSKIGFNGSGINWYDGVSSLLPGEGDVWHNSRDWTSVAHELNVYANEPQVYLRFAFYNWWCCTALEPGVAIDNVTFFSASTNTLNFDGTDDYVAIPDVDIYQQDFTWETFVKTTDDVVLFSYSNSSIATEAIEGSISMGIENGRFFFDQLGGKLVIQAELLPKINDDDWHHVAVSVDQDSEGNLDLVTLYVDGSAAASELIELLTIPSTDMMTTIGQSNVDYALSLRGLTPGHVSNFTDESILPKSSLEGRAGALALTDSNGDMWLFGGEKSLEYFNGLYKYDKIKDKWQFHSGLPGPDEWGNYGNLGEGSVSNYPGSRAYASGWVDENDNIWIFGGYGWDTAGNLGDLNDLWRYSPISEEWTWMGGSNFVGGSGVYGERLVAEEENIPGARYGSVTWTDVAGVFWLFGGYSYTYEVYFNDLWKYNVATSTWTWVSGSNSFDETPSYETRGVPSGTSLPGGRNGSASWVGNDGNLWLFGGYGLDDIDFYWWMNDLWKFDTETNEWTWVAGPSYGGNSGVYGILAEGDVDNIPGSKVNPSAFRDPDGNFWLFGGSEFGYFNDVFEFSPTTLEWTWWGGSNKPIEGVSGEFGIPGRGGVPGPGSRVGALTWTDAAGNMWMMGGTNEPGLETGTTKKLNEKGFLNDLWRYDRQANTWKYLGGSLLLNATDGNFGTKGLASAANVPPPRLHAASWTGPDGKLWFYGGRSPSSSRNDLWSYSPDENIFTWVNGNQEEGVRGLYGPSGVEGNYLPGAIFGAASWVDKDGMMWLFGGAERGNVWDKTFNDLWRYNPATNKWAWYSGGKSSELPGEFGEKGVPSASNQIGSKAYVKGWIDKEGNIWIFGGYGWDGFGGIGPMNDLWKYDLQTKTWTWMHGSISSYAPGYYGSIGIAGPENVPPARYDYQAWTDDAGDFWLLGGRDGDGQVYNDLWRFDPESNLWTWMAGSDYPGALNEPGEKGEESALNVIGARAGAGVFKGNNKNLWAFGGQNADDEFHNDLWEVSFIPGVPQLEATSSVGQTSFDIQFEEAWATTFEVQVATNDDFATVLQSLDLQEKQQQISGLEPGTAYFYRVGAKNEKGASEYSEPVAVLTLPQTPEWLATTAETITDVTQTAALLHWNSASGVFDGYLLDISTSASFGGGTFLDGYHSKSINKTETSELVANLSAGSEYFVRLRTYNASGESPNAEVIRIVTTSFTPENPQISELTQTSAKLNWESAAGLYDGFSLDVSTDNTFIDEAAYLAGYQNKLISKTASSENLAGLQSGTRYYIRIYTYNEAGKSSPTETLTLLTLPDTPIFTGADFLTGVSQTAATLKWTSVPEVLDGYQLEISTDFNFSNSAFSLPGYGQGGVPKSIAKASVSHQVTILEAGKIYYARVKAYNAAGSSPASNVVTIPTIPKAPELNPVANITQVSATLSWSTPPAASLYLVDLNTAEDFGENTAILDDFPLAVPFHVLDELLPGQQYHVRVQSANVSGKSGDTPDYGASSFITIPGAPILNSAEQISQTSAVMNWKSVKGAETYQVDVSNNGFQTLLPAYNAFALTDTALLVTGLEPGKIHQVRLKAVNISGQSEISNIQDVLTIPATPIARDASSLSTTSFRANWDPVAGATSYLLQVSADEFETFIFESTLSIANPTDVTGLAEGEVYKYRVSAANSSGTSPFSNLITVSLTPPGQPLAINNLTFNPLFKKGLQQSVIRFSPAGGAGELSAQIKHRGVGEEEWSVSKEMSRDDNSDFEFTVTADMLSLLGLEFEISLTDGFATAVRKENFIYWEFDDTQSDTIPLVMFGGKKSDWQMFSIPYVLKDNFIETIFNETAGLDYKVEWRLLHYLGDGNGGGKYVDKGEGINKIELGKGYWFNAIKPVRINVGAGQINNNIPFPMSLNIGWNQIGNPYNLPISWTSIIEENQLEGVVELLKVYDPAISGFAESDDLDPFAGAFVWSEENVVVQVSPSTGSGSAGRKAGKQQMGSNIDAPEWLMPLKLEHGRLVEEIGGFGMHVEASDGKDRFDKATLPRFVYYTDLYTSHAEYFYPWFSTDIVATKANHRWEFSLATNKAEGESFISWDNKELANANASLYLLDVSNGRLVDMKKYNRYKVNLSKSNFDFEIHYVASDGVIKSSHLLLGDAFPNPAEQRTLIPVVVPEGPAGDIQLSVFDLNGQLIDVVVRGRYNPGYYEFVWQPGLKKAIKSGMYLYQLQMLDSNREPLYKKLILK